MSDPQVEQYRNAMLRQTGGGDIQVFRGTSRYQYGQGFGDVLRSIWRYFAPVAIRAGKTLFKTGAEAVKEGAAPGEAMKGALRPALRTVLKHGGRALGDMIADKEKPQPAPVAEPLLHQDDRNLGAVPPQAGSGYKASRKRKASHRSKSKKHKKIRSTYNF